MVIRQCGCDADVYEDASLNACNEHDVMRHRVPSASLATAESDERIVPFVPRFIRTVILRLWRSHVSAFTLSRLQWILGFEQARREPERGPGNHYRGALSQPHSVCAEIETPQASTVRKRGAGCPLTVRLGVLGSVVSSPSGVSGGAPAENGFYAYLRSQRSHLEHPFQYF